MEIYPGSTCSLSDSGIHHCREGILIKVGLPAGFPRALVFPVGDADRYVGFGAADTGGTGL